MPLSVATLSSPEFINLQPLEINPLMSSCEIKVLYVGENRNRSLITKEVATEMAKTLRGAPIVGYYKEEKQDFGDHGDRVVIDDEGVKFECLTKPYGFVSPDAKVWFQEFEDVDDFGNSIKREYLMTTGYLWTGQFPEVQEVYNNGKPQSMELDQETLDGHWSTNIKTNIEFFIINDATFSKLCILGDDVEPCFEGASVTAPEISTSFSNQNDNFMKSLFSMMQDLKFALKGGLEMDNQVSMEAVSENQEPQTVPTESQEVVTSTDFESITSTDSDNTTVDVPVATEYKESSKEKEDEKKDEDKSEKENTDTEDKKDEDEDEKKKYSLLQEAYDELANKFTALQEEYEKLKAFKDSIEDQQKDDMINSFYMLSDEDKAEVIKNKTQYSLEEIESKLSVICVRKKVSFETDEQEESENITTYSLNDSQDCGVPAWIKAVKNTQSKNY